MNLFGRRRDSNPCENSAVSTDQIKPSPVTSDCPSLAAEQLAHSSARNDVNALTYCQLARLKRSEGSPPLPMLEKALAAASRLKNPADAASELCQVALAFHELGERPEAAFDRAISFALKTRGRSNRNQQLGQIALALSAVGDFDKVLKVCEHVRDRKNYQDWPELTAAIESAKAEQAAAKLVPDSRS